MTAMLKKLLLMATLAAMMAAPIEVAAEPSAKQVFGRMTLPANMKPASMGFYTKGCLAGAVAMPVDGPTWQTMRLSRNRRWGHPELIKTIEQLSIKANGSGWNGLLVGDISQPRGGPMLTGHSSHQIGLDADIWLTPMPDKRMSYSERENTSAISILKSGSNFVDDRRWNRSFEKLLHHAASFSEVERVLVHPGIKKKLCETVRGDRSWLSKVRPVYGHNYHFHIRMKCQSGSAACKKQAAPPSDTGCGEPLQWWFDVALAPKKKTPATKPEKPAKPKPELRVSDLPSQCETVVDASAKSLQQAEYQAPSLAGFSAPRIDLPKVDPLAVLSSKPIEANKAAKFASTSALSADPVQTPAVAAINSFAPITGAVPVPTPRPAN